MDAFKEPNQREDTYLDFIVEVFSNKLHKRFRKACLQQELLLLEELIAYGLEKLLCQVTMPHEYTVGMIEEVIEQYYIKTARFSFTRNDVSIARVYPAKMFGSFSTYCVVHSIHRVDQLNKNHFQQLQISLTQHEIEAAIAVYLVVAHGMPTKLAMSLLASTQMKRYVQTLPEMLIQWQSKEPMSDHDDLCPTQKETSDLEPRNDLDVKISLDILLPSKLSNALKEMDLVTLNDLHRYQGMFSFLRKKQKRDVIYLLSMSHQSLESLAMTIQEEVLTNENFHVLYSRVVERSTLEEVGLVYQVTRERIRQKELTLKTLWYRRLRLFLIRLDKEKKWDCKVFDIQVILDYFSDDKIKQLLEELLKDIDGTKLSYNHEFQGFFWDFKESSLLSQLSLMLVDDYFLVEDMYQQLKESELLAMLPYEYFLNALSHFGYQVKQRFAINCACSARKIVEIIALRHFPNGVQLVPDQFELINQLSIQEFGIDLLKGSKHYRNARVYFEPTSTNQLILWGKSTVIHINHVVIEEALRDSLLRAFDELMIEHEAISARFLYEHLEQYLVDTNLNDRVKLYGYIKHFYQNRFWFRKMFIRNLSKRGERIVEFIESYVEQHKVVTMLQLQEATKCNEITISATLVNSKKLVLKNHGRSMTIISEYHLPEIFKEELHVRIQRCLYKGYMTCQRLFQSNRLFFEEYGIQDEVEAFTISKLVLPNEYNFYRPFIQMKHIEHVVTYRSIFLDRFDRKVEVNLQDMESTCNQRLASKGITNVITKFFQDDLLFQLSKDIFCLIEDVSMKPMMIARLHEFVVSLFGEKEYVLKHEVITHCNQFPEIVFAVKQKRYQMSELSIRLLVKKYLCEEYTVFDNSNISSYIDRDYCIVPKDSPIMTYADFLYYLLKKNSDGMQGLRQREMLLILRDHGIIHKKLPIELEKEGYIHIDAHGIVSLIKDTKAKA